MTVVDETQGEPSDTRGRVAELLALREQARRGPSERATQAQHAKGKLTARERIELLLDPGSFREVEQLRRHRATGFGLEAKKPYTDGVITGWGTVEGRTVFVYAHDFRIFGGALGEAHATKIHKIMDMAISAGAPLVSLNDGAGARIQEGVSALAGYGGIFQRNTRASGVIPQISVMLGPCAGGAAYSPALTDFVFMVRETSQMFITGPDVVKAVTGEEITQNGLGGADVHAETSGVAHFAYDDEETCIAEVRYLIGMLPSNNRENPPTVESDDPADRRGDVLLDLVPADGNRPYDMHQVIRCSSTTATTWRSTSAGRATSSARWPAWTARSSASSPTSRRPWPVSWTSRIPRRPLASSRCATRSTSRSSPFWTSPASFPASTRTR
ncbi:Propionyl-CoA carboxylase beta chain [Streptomyces microflavus]